MAGGMGQRADSTAKQQQGQCRGRMQKQKCKEGEIPGGNNCCTDVYEATRVRGFTNFFGNRLDSHSKEHKSARVNKQTRLCAVATAGARARALLEGDVCGCFGITKLMQRTLVWDPEMDRALGGVEMVVVALDNGIIRRRSASNHKPQNRRVSSA